MPRFNIGQLLLLTALAALIIALATSVYTRARSIIRPEAIDYSPAGASAARFTDGTVYVWNNEGERIGSLDTREKWISFSFSKQQLHLLSESRVLATDGAGQLQIWDVESGKPTRPFGPVNYGDNACSVSGDGKVAATSMLGAAQPKLELWNLESGKRSKSLPAIPQAGMALSTDGKRLATLSHTGRVEIWDLETEESEGDRYGLVGSSNEGLEFAASSDLRVVAAVAVGTYNEDQGYPIELLDTATGQTATVYADHEVLGVRLSADGTRLAAIGMNQQVSIIDTGNGDVITKISPAWKETIYQLPELPGIHAPPMAFSPNGEEIAIASNLEIATYDAATGQRIRRMWYSQQTLSQWFFMPAFVIWGVLWGLARRRYRQSIQAGGEAEEGVINAEAVNSDGETTPARPPKTLIANWILLGIGGLFAIIYSLSIIFAELSCLALMPFPYYGLYVGLLTLSSGVGRRTDKLPLIHTAQILNIICCDPINLVLGITGLILANQRSARNYAAAHQ